MMRMFKNKKAQNTAEYAILIALVIAAAMAIQTYVKRGLQAKVRDAVISYTSDTDVATLGDTAQYEPYYLDTAFTTKTDSTQNVDEELEGGWTRGSMEDKTYRDGTQTNTAPIDGG